LQPYSEYDIKGVQGKLRGMDLNEIIEFLFYASGVILLRNDEE
jgi:hypothetical protein